MSQPTPAVPTNVIPELHSAFGAKPPFTPLPGGEGRSWRSNALVVRCEDNPADATFAADVYDRLPDSGLYRIPRPRRASSGGWLSPSGWSAWSWVDGRPATTGDLASVLPAIDAFHANLASVPRPRMLAERDSPYDRADRAAWGRLPRSISPLLSPYIDALRRVRKPLRLVELGSQLIHGDLNPDNILVVPNEPPTLIDLAAYWRPAGFAPAVLAYWIGAYRGDADVLARFTAIPKFDQLLVRAALRSVLIWHEFEQLGRSLDGADEEFATTVDVVVHWVERSANL